ncbi:hypothetical protein [Nitrosomonas sp. Is37]|uniref:hypothetical protein n=1 Tax=Nitrosomonas sp. Is37 TaxID=3080535 RepID=UPI00294B99EB|nr:hypothetical protein [Nitrosomonas sp. Is37]MDV6343991.1 hypothetical protein [Nitrosomonas sp. Is37]
MIIKIQAQNVSEQYELDSALVDSALSSFQMVLDLPITADRINKWISVSENGQIIDAIFSHTGRNGIG